MFGPRVLVGASVGVWVWMKNTFDEVVHTGEMLVHARQLYGELADQLREAIEALRDDPADEKASKEFAQLAKRYQEHLRTVLKLEADLVGKSDNVSGPFAGSELNLDDARREIRERLARLTSAGGNG